MSVPGRLTRWTRRVTSVVFWRRARKYGVALIGVAAQLLVAGVIPAPWDHRVQVLVAVLTAMGVYQVPNERTPSSEDARTPADVPQ